MNKATALMVRDRLQRAFDRRSVALRTVGSVGRDDPEVADLDLIAKSDDPRAVAAVCKFAGATVMGFGPAHGVFEKPIAMVAGQMESIPFTITLVDDLDFAESLLLKPKAEIPSMVGEYRRRGLILMPNGVFDHDGERVQEGIRQEDAPLPASSDD